MNKVSNGFLFIDFQSTKESLQYGQDQKLSQTDRTLLKVFKYNSDKRDIKGDYEAECDLTKPFG